MIYKIDDVGPESNTNKKPEEQSQAADGPESNTNKNKSPKEQSQSQSTDDIFQSESDHHDDW